MSALLAVERAVLDALRADVGVKAVLGSAPRVFDGDAEKPAYPYLELTRHSVEDVSGAEAPLWQHDLDLAVLSTVGGRDQAKAAVEAVRAVISGGHIAPVGFRCVVASAPFVDVMRATTHVWRAILRVRLCVEPAP